MEAANGVMSDEKEKDCAVQFSDAAKLKVK